MERDRVLVGMSGGVDSAAAAALLQEAGYAVTGCTLKLYDGPALDREEGTCCGLEDIEDARRTAYRLGADFFVFNCKELFRREVMADFADAYRDGRTPNPCVRCNRFVKFDALLRRAEDLGIGRIATGHYARVDLDAGTGRWRLLRGRDRRKDQSYFLYPLTQEQLSRLLLPLGELEKGDVRAFAEARGLASARKPDSQDICFVPGGDYAVFLERYTGKLYPTGDILDLFWQAIGRHQGAVRYTIGQRKGLGLAMNKPVYVCRKDMAENTVTVGPEQSLYNRELWADDVNWIAIDRLSAPMRVRAKIRYRQTEWPAAVYPDEWGKIRLLFDKPQRAITAGQAVVLYVGDTVVGGGTICL